MATLVRKRRLVNAGRRRRNRYLSPRQIKFFGTKRQKAALRAHNARKRRPASRHMNRGGLSRVVKRARRTTGHDLGTAQSRYKRLRSERRFVKRRHNVSRRKSTRRNVGSIITVYPMRDAMHNAGRRRKNVARRRVHHRVRHHNVRHRRRRPNVVYRRRIRRGQYMYSSNAGRRRRRHNVRHHRRRHNQGRLRRAAGGMFGGTATKVVSVIGGATVTKLVSDLLPATFQTGILGYVGVGVVAILQGQLLGRAFRSPSVRDNMTVGGLVYLTIKILNDFIPTLGGTLGLRGMGLISPTQGFAVPLVNQMGSMGMFVRPGFVPAPVPVSAGHTLGALTSIRRVGRVR